MTRKVILTCAVTGAAPIGKNSTYVPVTPEQIANEAILAARAGAAIVHLHVRDVASGAASMDASLYRELVERIHAAGTGVIINLTTGPGARYIPPVENPAAAITIVKPPQQRTAHVVELKPEVCTLDVATMNFGASAMVNPPDHLQAMAAYVTSAGATPELEVFELGHVTQALRLVRDGHVPQNAFFQLCLGIPGGAPATTETMLAMKQLLPPGAVWSAFGIGRAQMPMLAQSIILGGHCRVGLEDNLHLAAGVLSQGNAPLVARGISIIESLGASPATPDEARTILGLPGNGTRGA